MSLSQEVPQLSNGRPNFTDTSLSVVTSQRVLEQPQAPIHSSNFLQTEQKPILLRTSVVHFSFGCTMCLSDVGENNRPKRQDGGPPKPSRGKDNVPNEKKAPNEGSRPPPNRKRLQENQQRTHKRTESNFAPGQGTPVWTVPCVKLCGKLFAPDGTHASFVTGSPSNFEPNRCANTQHQKKRRAFWATLRSRHQVNSTRVGA